MAHFQPESFGAGSQGNFNQSFGSPAPSQMGGGFIAGSPGNSFGGSPSAFTQSTQQQKKRDTQSLLPVTIKQLLDAAPAPGNDGARIKIDGKELAQITFVCVILQVDLQSTNINYMMDDGSGKINVKVYIDADDESNSRHSQWREQMYVRVIGNLRVFQGVVSVIGFQLIPVDDFNEITFHMLQVISCHLKNTKAQGGAMNASGSRLDFSSPSPAVGGNMGGNMGGNIGGFAPSNDFNDVQKQVMGIFNQDKSDEGVHIDKLCQSLPHIPKPEIMKAIEFMSDEGHLYSTIDDSHFKSTDADD